MKSVTLKYNPITPTDIQFTNINQIVQIKKETSNIWEYKVGNNGNIANLLLL